jgi:hypothetical protein
MTSTSIPPTAHQLNGVDLDTLQATVRGIAIEALESQLEGDIDLNGFLDHAPDVPKDYTEIRARSRVSARPEDLPRIRELAAFSPVFNTITNSARVVADLQEA